MQALCMRAGSRAEHIALERNENKEISLFSVPYSEFRSEKLASFEADFGEDNLILRFAKDDFRWN